jgi:propionate catabolism operon transcriptional regulator
MKRPAHRPAGMRPRLCFVSYQPLSRLAAPVIEAFRDQADVEIVDAIFDTARDQALERERAGLVDAFVTAGANSLVLRGSVSRPVATIKVTGYDIMLALLKAREYSNRVGVVTYRETIAELDQVKAILDVDVTQYAYETREEARLRFSALAEDGYRVIVGSSIVVELAEQVGLIGVLAYSIESIRRGLEDALEMSRVARLETARSELLGSVLDNLSEAVLAVDERHRITAINPPMQALLGRPRESLLGRPLGDIEPALSLEQTLRTGQAEKTMLTAFRRRDWLAHRTPILEQGSVRAAVITLHDGRSISDADFALRSQRRGRQALNTRYSFDDLVGGDPAFRSVIDAARRFARTDLTVLITGESGSGKELFAQAIHAAGLRADRPFVAVNCSAFPESLLESELFGYEEGAFTGTRRGGKRGLFELAHTGTLFLDEIGDMPVSLQTRLLRVLQEREVLRLGGSSPVPVDLRIIAATHQPLEQLITRRRFRSDLFYRLNILRLQLPALRERRADILPLARRLIAASLKRSGIAADPNRVIAPVRDRLIGYPWPGNVRELENLCERLVVLGTQLPPDDPMTVSALARDFPELFAGDPIPAAGPASADRTAAAIREALDRHGGNRQLAARSLGISRATLWRRMDQLGLVESGGSRRTSHETRNHTG